MEFIDIPTERTTALTDAVLALLATVCILYLRQIGQSDPFKTNTWAWAFGLLAFSAVLGAVAHGFKMSTKTNTLFWQPLNLALGLTVALFVVGVTYDLWGLGVARHVLPAMIGVGVIFFVITCLIPDTFLVFIVYQVAAMLFALGAYGWLAITRQLDGAWLMTAGVLVTMIAAAIQAGKIISFTFIWEFDHNGVYHLMQMTGLVLITIGLQTALLS